MAHIKIEVKNARGQITATSVIPHGTEWFFPKQVEFSGASLYIKDTGAAILERNGRTVPPGGRLEMRAE